MKLRVGDRFENIFGFGIWEFTHYDDEVEVCICISSGIDFDVGCVRGWACANNKSAWRYLGNFSKSANFNSLYDILNSV